MATRGAAAGEHGGPLLFGHRGAPRLAPENTLSAFSHALRVGVDALEIDCHLTADGQVVVAHDPTGTRVASVDRRIAETTLGELQSWDVSRGFPDADGPARVPTLAEVLVACPSARLNVDLKAPGQAIVDAALSVIEAHGASGRVLLTSFAHDTLARVRAAGYPGETGCSRREAFAAVFLRGPLRRLLPALRPAGARLQIPTHHAGLRLATAGLIARVQGQGLRVDYWVVNEPAEAARLLDLGADGIVTDVPERIAEVFRTHPRTGGWRARHWR